MKVQFHRNDNIALITLVEDPAAAGRGGSTYTVNHPHARGMINLDFDLKDRLIEIEVMGAKHALPAEFLAEAKRH